MTTRAPDRLRSRGPAPARCVAAALGAFVAASATGQQASDPAREGFSPVQALQVVDCLLPGQIRQIGGRTYPTPRRPTRTTAADCGARGGEYLVYDRADYRSALNVWLPAAEDGDADAQATVGEIYERGLGGEPDYAAAAEWYRRAADNGSARAQYNLGALYEQGLGVAADRLEALNWYRRASGLDEDSVIFRSAAAAEQAALRERLLAQIADRDRQIDVLEREVQRLEEALAGRAGDVAEIREELGSVRALLEQLESLRASDSDALAAIPQEPEGTGARTVARFEEPEQARYRRGDFGRYYALLIGVQEYDLLDDLASPANDTARLAQVLEERYGFSVLTLADPDQVSVMRAVNRLNETLDDDDNLLIYFSGHGDRLQSGIRETGYWLPRNAEPPPDDTLWVPNDFVSRHLGRLEAKRVLVIADSCYSGLLGEEPGYVMVGDGRYTDDYIEWKKPKRSRLVLSSGGDAPVVPEAGHTHSVFASALLEAFEENDQVLTAPELFLRIRERIRADESVSGVAYEPEFKALKDAGHEVGDFFFIPARG